MDHIAQAMQNIRQASTDNASGIKQIEISLQRLNELGQKLKRLVSSINERGSWYSKLRHQTRERPPRWLFPMPPGPFLQEEFT
ncbi:hypothetical protein GMSM_02980 [Geomonas sp. Red276]